MKCSIEDLQKYGSEMLKEVALICEQENIPYIGMFGTMLGAVRHKGPIPWDYDIDIAVPVKEMERFVDVLSAKLPEQYWVDFRTNNPHKRIFPRIGLKKYSTKELHIDVYPIIGLPDSLNKQKILFLRIRYIVGLVGIKSYSYTGKKGRKARIIKALTPFITESFLMRRYDRLCRKYSYEAAKTVGCSNAASGYKRTFLKQELEKTILFDYESFKIRIPAEYEKVLHILFGDYMSFPPESERNEALNKKYEIEEL